MIASQDSSASFPSGRSSALLAEQPKNTAVVEVFT